VKALPPILTTAERAGSDVLTRAEVAAILHVHPKTVTRLAIPSILVGKRLRRWRRADVERWLQERVA
jgi:predicted DNA-binding transcriptional regulator AlpA